MTSKLLHNIDYSLLQACCLALTLSLGYCSFVECLCCPLSSVSGVSGNDCIYLNMLCDREHCVL